MLSAKESKGNPNRQTLEEIVSGKKEEPSAEDDDPDPAEWEKTSYSYDVTAAYYEVLTETTNGVKTSYDYGIERLSSCSGSSAWNTIKTQYVYDGRDSVAQELINNNSWYTFGGALSKTTRTSYSYTPFGELLNGSTAKTTFFAYNGESYDSATGMVNLRARQYQPATMRFSQRDIIKGDQAAVLSLNRYLYCENSPINHIDPSGESIAELWNKAKATVSNVATRVATTVSNAAKTVATTVTNAAKTVATTVSKVATYVATTVSDAAKYTASTVSNSVKQAATVVKSGAINAAAKITTAATTLVSNVKTAVSNTRTNVLDWYGRNEETINKCLTTAAIVAAAAVMVVGTIASLGTLPAIAGIAFAGTALATAAPIITTISLYGLAALTTIFGASNIGEVWSGTNLVRDTVFGGNEVLYNIAQVATATTSIAAMDTAARYGGLVRPSANNNDLTDETVGSSAGEYAGKQAAGATQSGNAGSTACIAGQVVNADETQAMQTYYPPNDGFLKDPESITLKPGVFIDRYGYPGGNYASPIGTPVEMRALPYGSLEKPYTVYEVVKPVNALSGQVAPWFGQIGLGTQFKFAHSFEEMITQGIIREVVN